ncbi:MAG: ATP-binding protein [Planctomycetota bacterium]
MAIIGLAVAGLAVAAVWGGATEALLTVAPALALVPMLVLLLFGPSRWLGPGLVVTVPAQVALVLVHLEIYHRPLVAADVAATAAATVVVYGSLAAALWTYRRRIRRIVARLSGRQDPALGMLAGGVAHDLGDLLSIALGTARIVERSDGCSSVMREDLEAITDALRGGTALVRELSGLMIERDLPAGPVEVNALLAKTACQFDLALPRTIDLKVRSHPTGLHVPGPAMQVKRCLLSLLLNARDAIDGAGRIELITARADLRDTRARRLGVAAGSYAVLSVVDSGCGMDARTRVRAFDPTCTTRPGQADGTGLTVVEGIVHGFGGFVDVTSRPARGCRVDLYLPLLTHAGARGAPDETPTDGQTVSMHERIQP